MNSTLTSYQIDKLNTLIRVISSDKSIKKWFNSLKDLPCNLRTNAVMQITTDMRRNEEDIDIISAVCTLCSTDTYNAAVEVIKALDE